MYSVKIIEQISYFPLGRSNWPSLIFLTAGNCLPYFLDLCWTGRVFVKSPAPKFGPLN
jgi:hypothetical protein